MERLSGGYGSSGGVENLICDEDRCVRYNSQGDGITGAGVDLVYGVTATNAGRGVEDVVFERFDTHLFERRASGFQNTGDEIHGHGPRQRGLTQSPVDSMSFGFPNPDAKRALTGFIMEDNNGRHPSCHRGLTQVMHCQVVFSLSLSFYKTLCWLAHFSTRVVV